MILTLKEYITTFKTSSFALNYDRALQKADKYKSVSDLWGTTIGESVFDTGFLHYVMTRVSCGVDEGSYSGGIALDVSGEVILGVIMYSQTGLKPCVEKVLGVWEINLVARTRFCPSRERGIGRRLIEWLEHKREIRRIVLVDDSGLPGYYSSMGYQQKGRDSWKWRLVFKKGLGVKSDSTIRDMYYKKLSRYKKSNHKLNS